MSLLERLSYYGVRSILVLFAIDESGLNLEQSTALEWSGETRGRAKGCRLCGDR